MVVCYFLGDFSKKEMRLLTAPLGIEIKLKSVLFGECCEVFFKEAIVFLEFAEVFMHTEAVMSNFNYTTCDI